MRLRHPDRRSESRHEGARRLRYYEYWDRPMEKPHYPARPGAVVQGAPFRTALTMESIRIHARVLALFAICSQIAVMVTGLLAVCCSDEMPMHHAASAMDACSMQHHTDDHAAHGGQPPSACNGPTIGCSTSDVTFFPLLGSVGVLPAANARPVLMEAGNATPTAPSSALRLAAVPLTPPPRV